MIETALTEEGRESEKEWQESDSYPKNYDSLVSSLINCDVFVKAIEEG